MDRLLKARKDLDSLKWYCENFLSIVMGRQTYNKQKFKVLVSKMATRSDEALLLVIMENSIEKWTKEYHNPAADPKMWGEPKYTKKRNETRKHQGWSEAGIARYNLYLKGFIPGSRSTSQALEVELRKEYCAKSNSFDASLENTSRNGVYTFMELESDVDDDGDDGEP